MDRSQKGTIFGHICFFIGDQAFPAAWYTDLVVAFVSAWFESLMKILTGKRNYERVRFYHNPYSVDITSAEEGAVNLDFIWHNFADDRFVGSFHARIRELTEQSMDAAERILAICEERGWSDPDIRLLESNLKGAALALGKIRARELP
jgi:hypothetical protein